MEKRGQVTVFIIIGLLILIFSGLFIMMKRQAEEQEIPEVIPENMFKLKVYADSCLNQALADAAIIMGTQGGYISVPENIVFDPSSYISLTGDTSPIGFKVPYWYHKGKSRIPTLEEMETELEEYINGNIDSCINGFSAFANEFDSVRLGNTTSDVSIKDTIIQAKATLPFDITTKGAQDTTRISQFSSDLDVNLKRMHQLAKEIMNAENEQMFFERTTIDLMALGPGIPFTDVMFRCGKMAWLKSDVEKDIKESLSYNLPKIRLRNTKHEPFLAPYWKYQEISRYDAEDIANGNLPKDVPPDVYDYFHYFWDATADDYTDITAGVLYDPDWQFSMEARPSKGNVMSSTFGKGFRKYLPFLCINSYHFTYDIIYPVMIILQDESALRGEGFMFRFAFPVLIDHNKGNRADFPILMYEAPEGTDTEACGQRSNDAFYINAKDRYDFTDIKDVNITFNCMDMIECRLGATGPDAGVYRLATTMPDFCSPGTIVAEHPEYVTEKKTVDRTSKAINIDMTPLRKMKLNTVKQRLTAGVLQDPEPLETGEKAIVFLNSEKYPDFAFYGKYPPDEDAPEEMTAIPFPYDDAVYEVNVILLRHDDTIIGGYSGNMTLAKEMLDGPSRITFRALERIPHPEDDDDIMDMYFLLEKEEYVRALRPVLE